MQGVVSVNELINVVKYALTCCMGVKPSESVSIITDERMLEVAEAFYDAAINLGCDPTVTKMIERPRHGAEPPDSVSHLMENSDIVVAVTSKSISHTNARRRACERGARVASLPGISKDCALRTLGADYEMIAKRTKKLSEILTKGKSAHVICPLGTDMYISLENREGQSDAGELTENGAFGNLPAGEAFLAPLEGKSCGRIVFASSVAGIGICSSPITLDVKEGFVKNISGDEEARSLDEILKPLGKNAYNIAELGIGTNDKAILSGSVLEDEKVFGTVHIALGDNVGFGGKINVPVHLDGIILKPDVYIDSELIIKSGEHLYNI